MKPILELAASGLFIMDGDQVKTQAGAATVQDISRLALKAMAFNSGAGASAGGKQRAANLSPERRSEIARAGGKARWAKRGR
jgi:hypothetical protein